MRLHGRTAVSSFDRADARAAARAPGKRTLTEGLVRRRAAAGFTGPSEPLPHGAAIQRAFGDHDLSGVTAHVGSEAAGASGELGANAYTRGEQIAFREAPDLFTAAHEAAHVVQQRAGAAPPAPMGSPGDASERHADEVAGRVVRGEPVADLLPRAAGAAPEDGPVQRQEDPSARDVVTLEEYAVDVHPEDDEEVPQDAIVSRQVEHETLIAALRESGVDAVSGSVVELQTASGTVPGLTSSDVQPLREAMQNAVAAALELSREELARKLGYVDPAEKETYCEVVDEKQSVGEVCAHLKAMSRKSSPRVVWQNGEEEPCDEGFAPCAACFDPAEPCEDCEAELARREHEECSVCIDLRWGKDQIEAAKRDEINYVCDVDIHAVRPAEAGGLPPALLLSMDIFFAGDQGGAVEGGSKLAEGAVPAYDVRVRLVGVWAVEYETPDEENEEATQDGLEPRSAAIVVEGPIAIEARDDDLEGLTKQIKKQIKKAKKAEKAKKEE